MHRLTDFRGIYIIYMDKMVSARIDGCVGFGDGDMYGYMTRSAEVGPLRLHFSPETVRDVW